MRKSFYLLIVLSLSACNLQQESKPKPNEKLTSYVDVFIGTGGHGHTFPGAVLPFGMVQLSPDNEKRGWDWCSGYHISDPIIIGFSHTHLSGTGCGDLQDVLFMPTLKPAINDTAGQGHQYIYRYKSHFDHNNEKAEPGYYSVVLDDSKIKVELTTTLRTGFHKYTFPESDESKIVIDLDSKGGWDKQIKTYIKIVDSVTVEGYEFTNGWAEYQKVFFAAKFSKPFKKFYTSSNGNLFEGKAVDSSKSSKAIVQFSTIGNEVIMVKVGISSASIESALNNLNTENPTWNFDAVRDSASAAWEKVLSKYLVFSNDEIRKKIFYTALYHSSIHPSLYSDVDGSYTGPDGKIHKARNTKNYYTFSLWDTFRALHPLLTLTDDEQVSEFIQAMMLHYREYGLLPVWTLWGNETYCMIGYHSIPVITDAYFKGIKGFDINEAYEAMRKSAMGHGDYDYKYNYKELDQYIKYGFLPLDVMQKLCDKNHWGKYTECASRTLEWAYDDWCIAQVAKALGKEDDYKTFMKRGESYKNIADTTIGFMRPRNSDGTWMKSFDPAYANYDNGFTEANSWQYSWFVPQNIPALITIMGGKDKFIQKLDTLFNIQADMSKIHFSDVSGMIGQYAHGNEPSHHVAYLYDYAGAPWKTQKTVAMVRDSLYKATTDGICGFDDCGQISAWYIFSVLGFYPVNPASGIYEIGTPAFDSISIQTASGKIFMVKARNISAKNIYIQSAIFNGKPFNKVYISHKEIMDGGVLEFEMGDSPNKTWGNNDDV